MCHGFKCAKPPVVEYLFSVNRALHHQATLERQRTRTLQAQQHPTLTAKQAPAFVLGGIVNAEAGHNREHALANVRNLCAMFVVASVSSGLNQS